MQEEISEWMSAQHFLPMHADIVKSQHHQSQWSSSFGGNKSFTEIHRIDFEIFQFESAKGVKQQCGDG